MYQQITFIYLSCSTFLATTEDEIANGLPVCASHMGVSGVHMFSYPPSDGVLVAHAAASRQPRCGIQPTSVNSAGVRLT